MKIRVYTLEDDCGQKYCCDSIDGIISELELAAVNDDTHVDYKVKVSMMDRDKFESLPEFEGF